MLNTMMENENTSFANILISFLRSCSQERDRNISKTCVFNFPHIIQHGEAASYTFIIIKLIAQINIFKHRVIISHRNVNNNTSFGCSNQTRCF